MPVIDPLKTAARWAGNVMSHHLADGFKLRRMAAAKDMGLKPEDVAPFPAMSVENTETTTNKSSSGMLSTTIAGLTTGALLGGLGLGLLTDNSPRPHPQEIPAPPKVSQEDLIPQKFRVRFYDRNGNEIKVEDTETGLEF